MNTVLPERLRRRSAQAGDRNTSVGRVDWSAWPTYDAAAEGLREYWYPVAWSAEVTESKPYGVQVCGDNVMLQRAADGTVRALHDRCLHRGVKLSLGKQEFSNTVTCPYHAWTYDLDDGKLVGVLTDGPDSPICGKVSVRTYPAREAVGLVWVYVGEESPHPLEDQLPEELVDAPALAVGGRIQDRSGDWRLYAENGFDEGHAKYLHRTAAWRLFKVMPTWNKIHIERHGRWLFRVEDERHWSADFPGLGTWTNERWWKLKPKAKQGRSLGNTGATDQPDPYIESQDFAGFASLSLPGTLRIAYPKFIHYEFYVPIEQGRTRYVGVMVQFRTGAAKAWFYARYLGAIRWLFHGGFSAQDHWMVDETDAPPERLYRPDSSLLEWRRLIEQGNPFRPASDSEPDGTPVAVGDATAAESK